MMFCYGARTIAVVSGNWRVQNAVIDFNSDNARKITLEATTCCASCHPTFLSCCSHLTYGSHDTWPGCSSKSADTPCDITTADD
jgi:hypothetical protein